jgi:serine/threonine-protein kinase RsbW
VPEPTLTRSISGRADARWLAAVDEVLAEAWRALPAVGEDDQMLFELAVHEIAGNMVEHAAYATCDLELRVQPSQLSVRMQDDGPATRIDLSTTAMPDLMAESGRGLAIAAQVLDVFEHSRTDGTNHWLLVRAVR